MGLHVKYTSKIMHSSGFQPQSAVYPQCKLMEKYVQWFNKINTGRG